MFTNINNGKVYIGKAENVLRRRKRHYTLAKMYLRKRRRDNVDKTQKELYLAMMDEGFTSFKFEILEYCPMEIIDDREQFWIKHFDSVENGYNMLRGFKSDKKYKEEDYEE